MAGHLNGSLPTENLVRKFCSDRRHSARKFEEKFASLSGVRAGGKRLRMGDRSARRGNKSEHQVAPDGELKRPTGKKMSIEGKVLVLKRL